MKRVKRRNNVDICAKILEISNLGAKKTWIVYRANLNFRLVNDYLDYLIGVGLLKYNKENQNHYQTTEQGKDFLEEYKQMTNLL